MDHDRHTEKKDRPAAIEKAEALLKDVEKKVTERNIFAVVLSLT